MKKIFLIILPLLILSCQKQVFAQKTCKRFIIVQDSLFDYKIDSLRSVKEYELIIELYNEKINSDTEYADYYTYNSARYYSLIRDTLESVNRILKTFNDIDKYKIRHEDVITESDFNIIHSTFGWKQIIDTLISEYLNNETSIQNKELSVELWFMLIEDQRPRARGDSPQSTYYYPEKYAYMQNRELRVNKLEKLIKKYGWPKYSEVGVKAGSGAFFVIQHSNPKAMKKYLPLLKEAAYNKEASMEHYALMLDRHLKNIGEKQLYGSQLSSRPIPIPSHINNKNDFNEYLYNLKKTEFEYYLWPIENEKEINKRRNEIGLENIEEYTMRFGLKYHYVPEHDNMNLRQILKKYGYILKRQKGGFYSLEEIK
jgi:hypothetical protein